MPKGGFEGEMRYKRALIILFDGARYDVFQELLDAGRLPNIQNNLTTQGSFIKGYSSIATAAGPAHIPFIYGIHPGTANVPGIRWFDKRANKGASQLAALRSYVGPGSFSLSSDIKEGYIPIYDYFKRPASIFSSLDGENGVKIRTNRLQKIGSFIFAYCTHRWERVDQIASQAVSSSLFQGCDFIFAVFPGIDEITHLQHPRSERVLKEYATLDRLVGDIFEGLPEGVMDETLAFIVSDHGLSKTHTHIPLADISRSTHHRPVFYPRIIARKWDIVIMESGNAMASVYFRDPVEGRPSFFGEFMNVEKNRRFINQLLSWEGIDFLAYRVEDSILGVRGPSGEIRFNFFDNGSARIEIVGANPLGFAVDGGLIEADDLTLISLETSYPDSPAQLEQLFRSDRTGDLVVFAREGFDLRKRYEWPEHKSSHGSLNKSHMEVPICTNAPLGSKWCRTVDVFPTILELLGHDLPAGIDGRSLMGG